MSGDVFNCYKLHTGGRGQECYLQCTEQLPTTQNSLVQNVSSTKVGKHCSIGILLRTAKGYRKEIWRRVRAWEMLSWEWWTLEIWKPGRRKRSWVGGWWWREKSDRVWLKCQKEREVNVEVVKTANVNHASTYKYGLGICSLSYSSKRPSKGF